MKNTLGVIFDMDGVLVDSYRAHFESWNVMLAERGRHMTEEQFAATFGRTSREVIASLWPEDRLDDKTIAAMDDRKEEAFREILAKDFPAMPGVGPLLRALHDAGYLLAVGSSGPPQNVAQVLDRLEAQSLFQAVVTGSDVTRGKPDPQVFLLAAERMGLAPRSCVVVEDAPLGIAAAQAAGMASIGLASTGRTRAILAKADRVVDTLREITPELVRSLTACKAA